jgi:hypothetical protein
MSKKKKEIGGVNPPAPSTTNRNRARAKRSVVDGGDIPSTEDTSNLPPLKKKKKIVVKEGEKKRGRPRKEGSGATVKGVEGAKRGRPRKVVEGKKKKGFDKKKKEGGFSVSEDVLAKVPLEQEEGLWRVIRTLNKHYWKRFKGNKAEIESYGLYLHDLLGMAGHEKVTVRLVHSFMKGVKVLRQSRKGFIRGLKPPVMPERWDETMADGYWDYDAFFRVLDTIPSNVCVQSRELFGLGNVMWCGTTHDYAGSIYQRVVSEMNKRRTALMANGKMFDKYAFPRLQRLEPYNKKKDLWQVELILEDQTGRKIEIEVIPLSTDKATGEIVIGEVKPDRHEDAGRPVNAPPLPPAEPRRPIPVDALEIEREKTKQKELELKIEAEKAKAEHVSLLKQLYNDKQISAKELLEMLRDIK